jgi:uncharacterized protein (UPF0305 family)
VSYWIEDYSGWLYRQHAKVEQMMERLVATIEKMDAKSDTNLQEMKAGHKHLNEGMLAKMETNQERMDAHHKRMMARIGS